MDPFTIAAVASPIISAVTSAQQSRQRQAEYERKAQEQEMKRAAARDAIAAIDFSPGSGIYELEQQRKLQAELRQGAAEQRADERESRAIAAMEDSRRAQAMMPRITEKSEEAIQAAELSGAQAKTEAAAATVAAEEEALAKGRERDLMLEGRDLTRAETSFDAYTQGAMGEEAARAEMNQALFSELGETAIALGGQKRAADAADAALNQQQDMFDAYMRMQDNPFGVTPEQQTMMSSVALKGFEDGGYIAKDGGVTEGAYSHKTNKIALIDEEDGKKKGEVTGGEFIFPPYFVEKMEDLLADGKYEEAGKYYQNFTSAPRFQEA